jgi:hypothetical protein
VSAERQRPSMTTLDGPEPLRPPDGYGNHAREGGTTPPDAGRTILTNLRCPVCTASFIAYKDQLQNIGGNGTARYVVVSPCCTAIVDWGNVVNTPSPLHMTVALWNGYLKCVDTSRGPTLILFERDVKALLDLHEYAQSWTNANVPLP